MAKTPARTRCLLTCKSDATFKRVVEHISKIKQAPTLISSISSKKAREPEAAVTGSGIRVVSVPLTSSQEKKIRLTKLCEVEHDVIAYTCATRATTIEAAIQEHPYPWGVKKIDADIIWNKTKGKGARVAVLDTGIEADHKDLKGNVIRGASFVENVASSADDNGHGTHCAGIIAAHGGGANAGLYGVAPDASVFPVKVFNYNGKGPVSAIVLGLEWCFQNNIDIVSMSFRVPGDTPSPALKQACETLAEKGTILVAAVGNDQEDKRRKALGVGYPARYDCVLGVGATDRYDTIASFSSTGKGVDLVAPGVGILSTYRNSRYREMSGTSQACPHVAGVAALLKAYRKNLTSDEIRRVLLETADPLGSDTPDTIYGVGLINASGAIEQLDTIVA